MQAVPAEKVRDHFVAGGTVTAGRTLSLRGADVFAPRWRRGKPAGTAQKACLAVLRRDGAWRASQMPVQPGHAQPAAPARSRSSGGITGGAFRSFTATDSCLSSDANATYQLTALRAVNCMPLALPYLDSSISLLNTAPTTPVVLAFGA